MRIGIPVRVPDPLPVAPPALALRGGVTMASYLTLNGDVPFKSVIVPPGEVWDVESITLTLQCGAVAGLRKCTLYCTQDVNHQDLTTWLVDGGDINPNGFCWIYCDKVQTNINYGNADSRICYRPFSRILRQGDTISYRNDGLEDAGDVLIFQIVYNRYVL